jgi:mono/diheme cytochrome c family protein
MNNVSRRQLARIATAAAVVAVAISALSADAFGHRAASVTGGEKLFVSSGCSSCHTFKAAGAKGTIGPSLDTVKLTMAQIVTQITNGGYAVVSKAVKSKYKFPMAAFKGRLTTAQIASVAAFVFADRNKAPAPGTKPATTTTTPAVGGTTTTTGGGGTTTAATTTTAGGTDTIDGCPPGKTIPTNGNTDADDDDTGAQTDGDGCI